MSCSYGRGLVVKNRKCCAAIKQLRWCWRTFFFDLFWDWKCLSLFLAFLNTELFPISLAYIHSVDLVKPLQLKLWQCLANVTFILHTQVKTCLFGTSNHWAKRLWLENWSLTTKYILAPEWLRYTVCVVHLAALLAALFHDWLCVV